MLDVRYRGFKLENNMITKEQAYTIAEEYLKKESVGYTFIGPIDKIFYEKEHIIPIGEREGETQETYSVGFGEIWGEEIRILFIIINATTGNIIYIITPHKYIIPNN